jgi:hypothetical protein
MMKSIFAIAFLLSSFGIAYGSCQVKAPVGIYCTSGSAAVLMFTTYDYNVELMHQSNNVALIHESGCGFVARGAKIQQLSHGRLPLVTGWAGVTTVVLNGSSNGYMADQYLTGRCDLYRPETYAFPGLDAREPNGD